MGRKTLSKRYLWFVLIVSFLTTPGFVCATRVERMEGEVDALRIQFEEIQQRINNDQTQLTEMIIRADNKLVELEELQRKATAIVTENSADLGVQMDEQKAEVASLRGELEQSKRQISQLQGEVRAIVSSIGITGSGALVLPDNANDLWTFASDKYGSANWNEAAAAYEEFAATYGSDGRIEEAAYKAALCHERASNFAAAVSSARGYLEAFPSGKYVNDAIFVMGEASHGAGDCETAKLAFESLKDTSSHKKKAREALKKKCP